MADLPVALPAGAEELISASEVEQAYQRMAAALQAQIDSADCVLLSVLLGGMLAGVRVASRLRGDFLMDYCHVTRYRGGQRGGEPTWLQAPQTELRRRKVLVVDDIFDEGVTLDYVERDCLERGAAGVYVAVLVAKEHGRACVGRRPDFVGLTVPDRYVFGCGMDLDHRWRHLDAIYALSGEG